MEQQASTAADGSFASSPAQKPFMYITGRCNSANISGSQQTSDTGATQSLVDPAAHTNQDQLHSDVSGAAKERADSNETHANSQHPTPTEEGASQPRDKPQVRDSSQAYWGRDSINQDGRMYPNQQFSLQVAKGKGKGNKRATNSKSKADRTPKKSKKTQAQQAVTMLPTIPLHGQGSNNQDHGSGSVHGSPGKEGVDGDHEEDSEDEDGSLFQLEEDHPFRKMCETIQTLVTKKLLGLEKM
jgi:hypothetical protein